MYFRLPYGLFRPSYAEFMVVSLSGRPTQLSLTVSGFYATILPVTSTNAISFYLTMSHRVTKSQTLLGFDKLNLNFSRLSTRTLYRHSYTSFHILRFESTPFIFLVNFLQCIAEFSYLVQRVWSILSIVDLILIIWSIQLRHRPQPQVHRFMATPIFVLSKYTYL